MIFWLFACLGSGQLAPGDPSPFHEGDPSIESIDWDCDTEENKWTFEINTEQWTGGGWVWMGKSSTNAEAHKIKSIEAAADGSSDRLKLTLHIEEDWRAAARGSSTRWFCSDIPELSFLSTVQDARATRITDCRAWGLAPSMWSRIESAHDCDKVIDLPEDSGR